MPFIIPVLAKGASILTSQLAIRGGAKVLGRTILNYMNKNGLDKAISRYGKTAVNKIKKIAKEKPDKKSSARSDDNRLIKRTSAQEKKIKDAKDAANKAREEKLRKAADLSNRKKLTRKNERFNQEALRKAKEAASKKSGLTVKDGTSRALTITKEQSNKYPLVVQRMATNKDVKSLLNNPSKVNTARLKKLEEGLEKGFPRNKLMNKIMAATTVGSIGALLLQDETKPTKADKPDRRGSGTSRTKGEASGRERVNKAQSTGGVDKPRTRTASMQDLLDSQKRTKKVGVGSKDKDKDKDDSSNVRTGSGGNVRTGSGGNVRTGSGGNVKTDRKKRKRPYDPSFLGIRMGRNFQSGGLVKADKYFKRGASNK